MFGRRRHRAARRVRRHLGVPRRPLRLPAGRRRRRVPGVPGPDTLAHAAAHGPAGRGGRSSSPSCSCCPRRPSCAGCGSRPPRRRRGVDGVRGLGDPPRGRLTAVGRLRGMELPAALYLPRGRRLRGHRADDRPVGPRAAARRPARRPCSPARRSAPAGSPAARPCGWPTTSSPRCRSARSASRPSVVRPGRRIELVETVLTAGDARPLMRLSAWRMRTRADGAAEAAPDAAPRGRRLAGQPAGDRRLLHRGRRLPPGARVAVRHRQLQLARSGVRLDPAGVRAGRRRADDAAAAPAGDDRRGQRHLRGPGLEHDDASPTST